MWKVFCCVGVVVFGEFCGDLGFVDGCVGGVDVEIFVVDGCEVEVEDCVEIGKGC